MQTSWNFISIYLKFLQLLGTVIYAYVPFHDKLLSKSICINRQLPENDFNLDMVKHVGHGHNYSSFGPILVIYMYILNSKGPGDRSQSDIVKCLLYTSKQSNVLWNPAYWQIYGLYS